ncbi:MAG: hypothetical protein JW952_05885 [Candidatus Eisenbacteria bacterium]|nr:hypothetical protein [Candidatus Eisenbacteria bacterium]
MTTLVRVLRLVASILFGGLAGGALSPPSWLPVGDAWRALVFVVGSGAAPLPADYTLLGAVFGRARMRAWHRALLIVVDGLAVVLVLAFLGIPETGLGWLGRIAVAAVVAGAVPGWPDAGRQGAWLFGRRV